MKDPARFALAIAAILSATALDAQQSGSSRASHEAESRTLAVRAGPPNDSPAAEPSRTGDVDENDGRISERERSLADATDH